MKAKPPIPTVAVGQQPKRRRGHIRVAAILATGIEVFTEKGYDAATMTEIAARSGTAIGSLYRFFPSKEVLADALLLRYAQQGIDGLAQLTERAAGMTPDQLATALVDVRLALQSQRKFANALIDARGGNGVKRREFRDAMRAALAAVLRAAFPHLTKRHAEISAIVVLQIFKGMPNAGDETPATLRLVLGEMRELMRVYLCSL
ncbi:MAG: TetR/AcrR family transcriptional regulator [Janthinobacterium lividum]